MAINNNPLDMSPNAVKARQDAAQRTAGVQPFLGGTPPGAGLNTGYINNVKQFQNSPSAGAGGATGSHSGVTSGTQNAWDLVNGSGQGTGAQLQGGGVIGGGAGGAGAGGGGAYSIDKIIQAQIDANNQSDAANTARYNSAADYLKGIPGQYSSNPIVQKTQGAVSGLLDNPEALNDATFGKIKNTIQNQIAAQGRNAFKQQSGILAAGGNGDASTLAAAAAAQARQDQALKTKSMTDLEVQRANQRNADITGAATLGRQQSAQDIGVPLGVGNSIMNNLLQNKPNDYVNLGMLGLIQQQNQNAGLHPPTGYINGKGPQQDGGLINQKPGSQSQELADFKAKYPDANPADWGF